MFAHDPHPWFTSLAARHPILAVVLMIGIAVIVIGGAVVLR